MTPIEIIQNADIVSVVRSYGIDVIERGNRYKALCQYHDDAKPSMTIIPATPGRKGLVHCFACGAHDDAAAFVQHMDGVDFMTAIKKLSGGKVTIKPRGKVIPEPKIPLAIWHIHRPETDELPDMQLLNDFVDPIYDRPHTVYTYRYPDGWPMMYIAIYDRQSGPMSRPWTWGRLGENPSLSWSARSTIPAKLPIYNLDQLAARPGEQVIITETEAAAVAAGKMGRLATCWPLGPYYLRHTDFTPLAGRRCLLVPENDEVSRNAMNLLAAILYNVGAIDVRGLETDTVDSSDGRMQDNPPGWSLSDVQRWPLQQFIEWAKKRALIYPKPAR